MLLQMLASAGALENGLSFGKETLTYAELVDRARHLAGGLQRIGVVEGDVVALIMPNIPEFAVSLLALSDIGAVALPLNPSYSVEEVTRYASTLRVATFLASGECAQSCRDVAHRLEQGGGRSRVVSTHASTHADYTFAALLGGPVGATLANASVDAVALYLHTSGTTGRSKLIPKTHAQLSAEARSFSASVGTSPDDVLFCAVPMHHAHGLGNCLLAALYTRARMVVLPPGVPLQVRAAEILAALESERVTVLPGVPILFDMLIRGAHSADLSAVRLCFSAGSPLAKEVFQGFNERFGIPIRQLYGCSEAGAVTINLDDDIVATWDSVGRPLHDVHVRIEPGGGGDSGDVIIRSPALTEGYFDAEQGAVTPFVHEEFRTQDLGRLDAAGRLYLTGRRRAFVEVAGHKVDVGEVEAVLMEHPDVVEAIVSGVPAEGRHGQRLHAVLVCANTVSRDALAAHCRARVASYKVPEQFEFRDAIPKGPLGKPLHSNPK